MIKEIEVPSTLTESEKIEYLKVAAEYWKNYYLELCRIVENKRFLDPSATLSAGSAALHSE